MSHNIGKALLSPALRYLARIPEIWNPALKLPHSILGYPRLLSAGQWRRRDLESKIMDDEAQSAHRIFPEGAYNLSFAENVRVFQVYEKPDRVHI